MIIYMRREPTMREKREREREREQERDREHILYREQRERKSIYIERDIIYEREGEDS